MPSSVSPSQHPLSKLVSIICWDAGTEKQPKGFLGMHLSNKGPKTNRCKKHIPKHEPFYNTEHQKRKYMNNELKTPINLSLNCPENFTREAKVVHFKEINLREKRWGTQDIISTQILVKTRQNNSKRVASDTQERMSFKHQN